MKRRIFNLLAAPSLLLCTCLVVIWCRSEFREDEIIRRFTGIRKDGLPIEGHDSISVFNGVIAYGCATSYRRVNNYNLSTSTQWAFESRPTGGPHPAQWTNLKLVRNWYPNAESSLIVCVPCWLLILPTALVSTIWLRGVRSRRMRRRAGVCPNCGYDLRATPERCPECGTEVRDQHRAGTTGLHAGNT